VALVLWADSAQVVVVVSVLKLSLQRVGEGVAHQPYCEEGQPRVALVLWADSAQVVVVVVVSVLKLSLQRVGEGVAHQDPPSLLEHSLGRWVMAVEGPRKKTQNHHQILQDRIGSGPRHQSRPTRPGI